MAQAQLTFALYEGAALQRHETVVQDIIKVGKDPKSHLRVDNEQASRMHAVIEVGGPEAITIIDLGNEPGTLVNGTRINKCALRVGDEIQVGTTRIVLEAAAAPAPRVAAPAANPFVSSPTTNPFDVEPAPAGAGAERVAAFAGFNAVNPFAAGAALSAAEARARSLEVPDDAEPGTYTYSLIKSGPDVNPAEVELQGVASVEVMILWGTNVLSVAHLTPPRDYFVGEEQGAKLPTDFLIPAEKLGTTRMPLVLGDAQALRLVIPPGATGQLELPGQGKLTLDQARSQAQPSASINGGHELPLPGGAKARIAIDQIVFQIATVNAGKPTPLGIGSGTDWAAASYFGLSALVHAAFIGALAFFVPPMNVSDDDGISKDNLRLIQQLLSSAAEREQAQRETDEVTEENADDREGGTGERAGGEEGSMGKPTSTDRDGRYGVKGSRENTDPHIARAEALREAEQFGMIGILNTAMAGDPNTPTAPWGRDDSLGTDEVSARGNLWGSDIHDAFGAGGLGLSGIGEGGGGLGEGIGLGDIGGLGHGAGTGTGQGFGPGHGFGFSHGRAGGTHQPRSIRMRTPSTTVSGRLPPEVIQRIVRQNYGRFRMCYEQGLTTNPNLEGRVAVRFVIGRDGAVSNAANGGSDLPNAGVVDCVVRAYYGLSFPSPEGGIVTVVYPIMFSPG